MQLGAATAICLALFRGLAVAAAAATATGSLAADAAVLVPRGGDAAPAPQEAQPPVARAGESSGSAEAAALAGAAVAGQAAGGGKPPPEKNGESEKKPKTGTRWAAGSAKRKGKCFATTKKYSRGQQYPHGHCRITFSFAQGTKPIRYNAYIPCREDSACPNTSDGKVPRKTKTPAADLPPCHYSSWTRDAVLEVQQKRKEPQGTLYNMAQQDTLASCSREDNPESKAGPEDEDGGELGGDEAAGDEAAGDEATGGKTTEGQDKRKLSPPSGEEKEASKKAKTEG